MIRLKSTFLSIPWVVLFFFFFCLFWGELLECCLWYYCSFNLRKFDLGF